MIDPVIVAAQIIVSSLTILVFLLITLTAIGDMVQGSRKMHGRPLRKNTTIIVLAEGAGSLERCLRSVAKASIGRHDIVVVDVSQDDHRSIRHQAKARERTILYRPRTRHTQGKLLALAYARSQKADIVMVIHDSVCLVSGSTRDSTGGELFESSARPIRLREVSAATGFSGVVLALRTASIGLVENSLAILNVRRAPTIDGRAYVLPAGSIKKGLAFTGDWRYDTRTPKLTAGGISMANVTTARNIISWLIFGALVASVYVLVAASIDRSQADVFMFVWLLVSVGCTAIIMFDPFLHAAQKIRSVACVGFMPILALMAVVVKMNRT